MWILGIQLGPLQEQQVTSSAEQPNNHSSPYTCLLSLCIMQIDALNFLTAIKSHTYTQLNKLQDPKTQVEANPIIDPPPRTYADRITFPLDLLSVERWEQDRSSSSNCSNQVREDYQSPQANGTWNSQRILHTNGGGWVLASGCGTQGPHPSCDDWINIQMCRLKGMGWGPAVALGRG